MVKDISGKGYNCMLWGIIKTHCEREHHMYIICDVVRDISGKGYQW